MSMHAEALQPRNTFQNRFSRAAHQYNKHARIQKEVGQYLWDWAKPQWPSEYKPKAAVDVGSGTGFMTGLLLSEFLCPVHAVDVAPGMIDWLKTYKQTPRLRTHLLDAQTLQPNVLPLPSPAILMSSMCVQWFDQLENALQQWLELADVVCLSVLLEGSFEAWHGAHRQTGQNAGLRPLPREADLKAMLERFQNQGLAHHHSFKTHDFLDYQLDGLSFARSLRAIGADTPKPDHKPVNLRAVINELGIGCTMNYKVGFIYLSRL